MTAALAGLFAAALIVGGLTTPAAMAVAVALVQSAYASRWFPALQVRGGRVGAALVLVSAVAADIAVVSSDDARPMGEVPVVLAATLLGALAVQLARRDGRPDLAESLVATGSAAVLAGLGAAWLALTSVQRELVVITAVAALAVPVLDYGRVLVRARHWHAVLASGVLAIAAGAAVAAATELSALAATGCAALAAVAARVAALVADRSAAPTPLLSASFPLVLAAPAAYLAGRVLVG